MGILPILIGLKHLWELRSDKNCNNINGIIPKGKRKLIWFNRSKILSVLTVTVSNGGDNIGVYVPLFTVSTTYQVVLLIIVFLLITFVWCYVTYYIVHHTIVGDKIRRCGYIILPFTLIALGVWILLKSYLH